MAEDLLMQLPPEGSLTTLPGGFTSGAAEAKVVGGKTLLQDALRHHPSALGTGAHVLPALLLLGSLCCWSVGMTAGSRGVGGRGHERGLCRVRGKGWCCTRTLAVLLISRLSSVSNFQGN